MPQMLEMKEDLLQTSKTTEKDSWFDCRYSLTSAQVLSSTSGNRVKSMVSPSLNLKVSFCISFGAAACDILDNVIRREGDEMD